MIKSMKDSRNKRRSVRMVCVVLAFCISIGLVSGCDGILDGITGFLEGTSQREKGRTFASDEEEFDLLMDEVFADWVSGDALTMNYFLADPYRLDIERPEPTFGEVLTPELIAESKVESAEFSDYFSKIQYDNLRYDQQIVYDILARRIAIFDEMEREEDFYYYTGYIRPLNGIQVQLPILLVEFSFYTPEDIERYLDLLADTYRYFNDIIEFERERSGRGFFLSDANVDSVIEQIESFLENRDENFLITVFEYRIDDYDGLSQAQKDEYKQKNKALILDNVLPAYDSLLSAMKELRGVGAHDAGLAALPSGSEFAYAYLRLRTGTDRHIRNLENLLGSWLDDTWMKIMSTLHEENPALLEKLFNDELGKIDDGTPEEYIYMLQELILEDFPPIQDTRLEVFEVHESLQDHMSPAFYLAPAIDRFDDNVVYVNPLSIGDDNLFLFTVLAHESYPGHMYQTVYFLQQSPHPVRTALSNIGYSEGWATYVEMVSYFYSGLDDAEAELMWNIRLFDMLLSAYIDLGVNVLGWNFQDVSELLAQFNIVDSDVASDIYERAIGVPLFSLPYALGYIELMTLKQDMQRLQGEAFDLMEFHRFFLDFGPAPFEIISDFMYRDDAPQASTELDDAA